MIDMNCVDAAVLQWCVAGQRPLLFHLQKLQNPTSDHFFNVARGGGGV